MSEQTTEKEQETLKQDGQEEVTAQDTASEAVIEAVGGSDDHATSGTEEEAGSEGELGVTIARLEEELAEAKEQAAAQLDQLQRLAAEFQNSKRRQEKQLADAIDRAGSQIIQQLLPVLDDFDLAFQNVPETLAGEEAAWIDGFAQIQKKLRSILDEQGVEQIPTEGPFDPNLHEAVTSEPNEDVESGHIIATLRVGYRLKGRVLRPALVRVAM